MSLSTSQRYAFDNHSDHAGAHHGALHELLDEFSTTRAAGLRDLSGARCLEVAAGGGRFALWLAEQVGPRGEVVATDLKPDHIPSHPRLRVRTHDIVSDPLEEGYDLIHARLLLNHLPARQAVLRKLAGALNPGGVLLTEDFDPTPGPYLVAWAPTPAATAVLARYQEVHLRVLASHGNDRGWSRQALGAMTEAGLRDVEAVVYARSWRGGGPGCRLLAAGLEQLRDKLIAAGLPAEDLDEVRALLADPRVVLHGNRLISTSGYRAAETGWVAGPRLAGPATHRHATV